MDVASLPPAVFALAFVADAAAVANAQQGARRQPLTAGLFRAFGLRLSWILVQLLVCRSVGTESAADSDNHLDLHHVDAS